MVANYLASVSRKIQKLIIRLELQYVKTLNGTILKENVFIYSNSTITIRINVFIRVQLELEYYGILVLQ